MNILLTSASRKIWLVKAFESALKRLDDRGHVFVLDKDPLSATLYYAPHGRLWPYPPGQEQVEHLKKLCSEENISLIIPTRDGELAMFADGREALAQAGIMVLVSPLRSVEICQDKYQFYKFCRDKGYLVPETWLPGDRSQVPLPWFIKPRCGSGSIRTARVDSCDQAAGYLAWCGGACVIQKALQGIEYTVDVFCGNAGQCCSVVRQRIEVVAGESYKTRTVQDPEINSIAECLVRDIGGTGHLTVQCMRHVDGKVYVIEMNPRIGGGANLGIKAGLDTPCWMIRMAKGEPLDLAGFSYGPGLIMLRYTDDIFITDDQVLREDARNAGCHF